MKFLSILFFVFCSVVANAHTIWLDTNTSGKMNEKHEVKVFFGEPDSPTPTERWFSDIKDLKIKLVSPSGKEMILEKKQEEKYYSAFFTPNEKGVYTISLNHLVKDTFRDMKLNYQSVAFVSVDFNDVKELTLGDAPVQLSFDTNMPKIEENKIFRFIKSGEIAKKEGISITSQNGWGMKHKTNSKGEIKFKPLWDGKFLVELSLTNKEEGTHNGKPYKGDYHTINYLVSVK